MALSTVDVGTTANDGTGDPLRTAFQTVNTAIDAINEQVYLLSSYASLAAAITAIGATPARLYINATETLTADATIPATMVLAFGPSGQIATGTYTLTVNGGVDARRTQIFDVSGGGSVSGAPILDHAYPEWFGADGAGNDATEVQNALNFAALAGAWVDVAKSHAIGGDLTLNSGQLIRGVTSNAAFTGLRMYLTGTAGSQLSLTGAAAAGATSISVDTSTLSDGDWVKIASVINSGSSDAGEYQLGDDTAEESYLSEFVQILDATSSGSSATLRRELTFPYSNTPATDTAASLTGQTGGSRTSVVWEITWCEGVRVMDMALTTINTGAGNDAIILGEFAKDCVFERCNIDTGDVTGWAASFTYSLDCTLENCEVQGKVTSIDSGSSDNTVLFQSSTNCYVRGGSIRGGNQGVDVITFGPDVGASGHRGGPSIGCGALGVWFENQQTDCATSHPGNYGSQFNENRAVVNTNGIRLRSPFDQAHDNVLIGGASANGRGIFASGGVCRGASIKGNTLVRLQRGISVEPQDPSVWTLPVNVSIQDNVCWFNTRAIQLVSPSSSTNQYYGAHVSGNESYGCTGSHILVEDYFNGAKVVNNCLDGVASGFAGIEYEGNQSHLFIDRNHTRDVNGSGYSVKGNAAAAITDTVTFSGGEADAYWYIGTHYGEGSATGISHGATAKLDRTDLSSEAYTFTDLVATDVTAETVTLGDGSSSVPLAITRAGSTGAVGVKFENSVGPVTLVADGTGSGAGAMYALFGSTVTFGTSSTPWKSFYSNDGYFVANQRVVSVQQTTGVAEAAFVENSGGTAVNVDSTFGGYTIQQITQALQNHGLLA